MDGYTFRSGPMVKPPEANGARLRLQFYNIVLNLSLRYLQQFDTQVVLGFDLTAHYRTT